MEHKKGLQPQGGEKAAAVLLLLSFSSSSDKPAPHVMLHGEGNGLPAYAFREII